MVFDATDGGVCTAARRRSLLTAGLGTRLRPLTYVRAKPAVPVNGEPLVAPHPARGCAGHGIRDVVAQPAPPAGDDRRASSATAPISASACAIRGSSRCSDPAGGPRHALPLLTDGGASAFLIVNGDTLTDVDVAALLDAARASGALVTMALIPNPRPDKYGGVQVSDDGSVTGFTRRGTPRRVVSLRRRPGREAARFARSTTACRPSRSTRSIRGSSRGDRAASRRSSRDASFQRHRHAARLSGHVARAGRSRRAHRLTAARAAIDPSRPSIVRTRCGMM